MEGIVEQIGEDINQAIKRRHDLAGNGFPEVLYRLYCVPDAPFPDSLPDELIAQSSDIVFLNSLPAERFVEFLTLMHVLGKRISDRRSFDPFHEVILEIALTQIKAAKLGYIGGAASVLAYFLSHRTANPHDTYVEQLLIAYDAVLKPAMKGEDSRIANVLSDYSLANGLTGLLLVLLRACRQELENPQITAVVQRLNQWTHAQVQTIISNIIDVNWELESISFFPRRLERGSDLVQVDTCLNWSAGDLGQVFLLYTAADFWQNSNYYRTAEQIGTYTLLRKDVASTGITHADFKTGSSGLAYMYNRLWRHTQNAKYLDGARFWHKQTAHLLQNDLREAYYQPTFFGLFDGVTGVCLVNDLMHSSGQPADWMAMLLL